MSTLDTLKLVEVSRKRHVSAEVRMREKVIASLNQQAEMVRAELEGRIYTINIRRYEMDATGQRVATIHAKQPRKWFWKDINGTHFLQLSYCNMPVVIANGQKVVEVGKLDALPAVIETLVQAVNAGELDAALKANQKERYKEGLKKRMASKK